MICSPTNVLAADAIDVAALKEKYGVERDRRIRPDGQKQYARVADDFQQTYTGDPHLPVIPRLAVSEDIDVAVLGAGWSGLLAGVHLRKAGVTSVRNIDLAGDFGGVWYWNRYPGVQCDNDAYCYLPMLEEMGFMPSKKFSDGWEIYEYMRSIGDRFGLYESALFHTLVTTLRWDESIRRWCVKTDRGDEIRARFVIAANGLLNMPKLPDIPGIHEFGGKMFHTARWDYGYTGGSCKSPALEKLADKRVAIIGTGATAIQAIPYLGRYAHSLYVLQRTPSVVDARPNPLTDPDWVRQLQPGWQKERQANFNRAAVEGWLAPDEPDLVCDFWTEITRNLQAQLRVEGNPKLSPQEYFARREVMDYQVMDRMRRRVDEIVADKNTAEALKPWYRFLCKRPLSNNEYLQTFNRENVQLIDVSAQRGLERITADGFIVAGVEHKVDCLIFASGFEVTSDLNRRWGFDTFEGRGGLSIYDHWREGYRTLHGMMSHGFPNLFLVGLYQGGFNGSITEIFNRQTFHIAHIIQQALLRGATSVEPTEEAQDAWVAHVRETAFDVSELQRECTPSYFNNEGKADVGTDGKARFRWYLGESYGPGWDAFQKILQDWRVQGKFPGLSVM